MWGALLVVASCSDATAPRQPKAILLSAPSISLDAIGAGAELTAKVLDDRDQEIPDARVTWTSSSDAIATVSPAGSVTSHANGQTTITARIAQIVATATVTVAQTPVTPQKVSGDAQTGTVDAALPVPVVIKVVDRLGHPIAGQNVSFVATPGNGRVATANAPSGADGTASTLWTLGPLATQQQLTVAIGTTGLNAFFAATAVAGAATSVGFASPSALVVRTGATDAAGGRARDANGNVVANTPLTYVSRNPSVATVSPTGVVAGVSAGQTVIVAALESAASTADSIIVVIADPGAVVFAPSFGQFSLRADTTLTVNVVVTGPIGRALGSALATLTWDTSALAFVGTSVTSASVVPMVNTVDVDDGSLTLAFADAAGQSGGVIMLAVTFRASTTTGAGGSIRLTGREATTTDFTDLGASIVSVSQLFRIR